MEKSLLRLIFILILIHFFFFFSLSFQPFIEKEEEKEKEKEERDFVPYSPPGSPIPFQPRFYTVWERYENKEFFLG